MVETWYSKNTRQSQTAQRPCIQTTTDCYSFTPENWQHNRRKKSKAINTRVCSFGSVFNSDWLLFYVSVWRVATRLNLTKITLDKTLEAFESFSSYLDWHFDDWLDVVGVSLHVSQVLAQKGELPAAEPALDYLLKLVGFEGVVQGLVHIVGREEAVFGLGLAQGHRHLTRGRVSAFLGRGRGLGCSWGSRYRRGMLLLLLLVLKYGSFSKATGHKYRQLGRICSRYSWH